MCRDAVGNRVGAVLPAQRVPMSMSDVHEIVHIGVPQNVATPWQSAAGGVGRSYKTALLAAIGEGIERMSAATVRAKTLTRTALSSDAQSVVAEEFHFFTDTQRSNIEFPFENIYSSECPYVEVRDLADNSKVWAPQPLVTLQDNYQTGVPTSSGLAAGPSLQSALLRGIQELIERDSLMVTWMHGVPGRRVQTARRYIDELRPINGEIYTFDLTPIYSPFPVVAVMGGIKKDGKWRYSLGVACRESWQQAEEKAYLEWNQGVLFAGIYDQYVDVSELNNPYTLRSFDEHAMYYTVNPEMWHKLAIFSEVDVIHSRSPRKAFTSEREALLAAKRAFIKHDIRVYYRNITTIDAEQVGVSVVKVLSPDMAMIFAHQEWPFIDKVGALLSSRYPGRSSTLFPYMMPHPLG